MHLSAKYFNREKMNAGCDGWKNDMALIKSDDRKEGDEKMARKTIEQRLAELDAQRATLKARLSKQERARDTRRKVLLGALVLHRLEHGRDEISRALPEWLRRELPGFLTRDIDKELFADLLGGPPNGGAAP